jgi:hypothetical protein
MSKRIFITLFGFLALSVCDAQVHLHFSSDIISSDSTQIGAEQFRLVACKFYVGRITLFKDDHAVWTEGNTYHLVDVSHAGGDTVCLAAPHELQYDHVSMVFGIDSITNSSGALGGDLDPMLGMYWTWQSGYIFTKIEGTFDTTSGREELQLHLGGYSFPENAIQEKTLACADSSIHMKVHMRSFLQSEQVMRKKKVMSPSLAAVEMANIFVENIHLVEP